MINCIDFDLVKKCSTKEQCFHECFPFDLYCSLSLPVKIMNDIFRKEVKLCQKSWKVNTTTLNTARRVIHLHYNKRFEDWATEGYFNSLEMTRKRKKYVFLFIFEILVSAKNYYSITTTILTIIFSRRVCV